MSHSGGRLISLSDDDRRWARCAVCSEPFARWPGPTPTPAVWLGRPGLTAVCVSCLRNALDLVEQQGGLKRR